MEYIVKIWYTIYGGDILNLTKWLLVIVFLLPIILVLIHGIIKPKESFLFDRRWQFKNDMEPSEFALDIHRLFSIAILVIMLIILVTLVLS